MFFEILKKIDDKITPRLVEKDLLIPAFFFLCIVIETPGLYFLDKYAKKQEKIKQEQLEKTKVNKEVNTFKVRILNDTTQNGR